jgi:pimeloyl-ACP methyl ester carboxylesterase
MSSMLEMGDVRLAYDVTGNGPPLLLLHGAEGSRRMFDALVPHLSANFTTITYDQRDCGDTTNAPGSSSLADLADDAATLLRTLGCRRAHVYGTSFGGRVAQMLALRHPEVVDRLVLGSTWPLPVALEEVNSENVTRIRELRAGLPETAEALAGYFLPEVFLAANPALKGMFRNAPPRDERTRRRALTTEDRPAMLPSGIAQPTLLMVGEFDRVVPPSVTLDMGTSMACATTLQLAGLGHAGALQAPAVVAEAVRRFCTAEPAAATTKELSP